MVAEIAKTNTSISPAGRRSRDRGELWQFGQLC